MVDKAKPGDLVQIIGILKPVYINHTAESGIFLKKFIAYSITVVNNTIEQKGPLPTEIRLFKKISKSNEIIDLLVRSFAPSIEGHKYIKEALLL